MDGQFPREISGSFELEPGDFDRLVHLMYPPSIERVGEAAFAFEWTVWSGGPRRFRMVQTCPLDDAEATWERAKKRARPLGFVVVGE